MPDDEGLREPEKHQGLQRRGLDTQTCRRGAPGPGDRAKSRWCVSGGHSGRSLRIKLLDQVRRIQDIIHTELYRLETTLTLGILI